MIKMVPADKTAMSSPVSLLRVFFFVFLSRIVEIDVNYIHIYIYIYIYIQARFAGIYWYNNKDKIIIHPRYNRISHFVSQAKSGQIKQVKILK